jgi:outer membrane protein assembly factor BamA
VPWIGEKLRLFASLGAGYYKTRNMSPSAVGKSSGTYTLTADEQNYDNFSFNSHAAIGKYITGRLAVFTNFGYDYIRVSSYAPGRTVSPTGKDKYLTFGIGVFYDSRDVNEFATKGHYFRTHFQRYGLIDGDINFGNFTLESQNFLPVYFTEDYYITIASKLFTSLAVGAFIPVYHHKFLGYSPGNVRGWNGIVFEGEDQLTLLNEIRIPLLTPRYINAQELPIVEGLPVVKKFSLKYGLYFTLFYDVGAVWYKDERIQDVRFVSGTGIGINIILPFGYVARCDWGFRITKPVVGQVELGIHAKF